MKMHNTLSWNFTEHLQTQKEIAAYLEATLKEGDPELFKII